MANTLKSQVMKPQDVVLLLKLLSLDETYSQAQFATELCMSVSEINACVQRLIKSNLIHPKFTGFAITTISPILTACEEFLIHGLKYAFPTVLGSLTRGVPTSYAAPIFNQKLQIGNEPPPVWPDAHGDTKGIGLSPLYPSVPESIRLFPNDKFYALLAISDALRQGRAREREIAIKLLKEILKNYE